MPHISPSLTRKTQGWIAGWVLTVALFWTGPISAGSLSLGGGGTFDPVVTTQSGVAIRFGSTGPRTFLNQHPLTLPTLPHDVGGGEFGGLAPQYVGGLNIVTSQTTVPLWSGSTIVGSVTTETYSMTNVSGIARSFEMVRYLNGLSNIGGGGRMPGTPDHFEMLFETVETAGMHSTSNYIGIASEGGSVPESGRYEISVHSGLRNQIISGAPLNNGIAGDMDYDQFIDAGHSANVALALRNVFTLEAGASDTYMTITVLGFGSLGVTTSVPAPPAIVLLGIGGLGLAGAKWRKRRTATTVRN